MGQTTSFGGAANLNAQMGNLNLLGGKEGKESRLSLGSLRSSKEGKDGSGKDEGTKKKSFLGKMKW